MYVIIQTPIEVHTPEKHQVYDHIRDEEVYNTETFDLSHVYNNGGIFTVTLVPINKGCRLEQYALKFTVDYNTLGEIYKEPSKFIKTAMNQYDPDIDDMCAQINDRSDIDYVMLMSKLPTGFVVVTYNEPNGSKDIIVYHKGYSHEYTDDEKLLLDELLGAGRYKLLDCRTAKRYIRKRDQEKDHRPEKQDINAF